MCIRQPNLAKAISQILLMLQLDPLQMQLQWRCKVTGNTVTLSLPLLTSRTVRSRCGILPPLTESEPLSHSEQIKRSNQSMKPTAPDRANTDNLATTLCRGLSLSR
jgi:hypothetical protein